MLLDYFQMAASGRRARSGGERNDATGVESLMVSFVLTSLMESPVLVEIATGSKGAQTQYGFGSFEPPLCACHLHTVFYQVPACPLDDPCGDGEPWGKVTIIVKIGLT